MKAALISAALAFPSISTANTSEVDNQELKCLARNIYFEANNQSIKGQLAVGLVTLNRVNDSRFPNSICSVVHQAKRDSAGNPIRNKCQFSWYCDSKSDKMPSKDNESVALAYKLATYLLVTEAPLDVTKGAIFFHTNYVSPSWAKKKGKTVVIGDHIFYK